MHQRDYLVKQFEEFGKVMAVLLGLKKSGNDVEFLNLITETAKKYTATEIEYVESIFNNNLMEVLVEEKELNDEQLKMLADLLYEKAEYYLKFKQTSTYESDAVKCYEKAYTIYLFVRDNATLTYSLDLHYKLDILSTIV